MIDVVAIGAISPLGVGAAAWSVGAPGEPARVAIAEDPLLRAAGLRKPYAARAPISAVDPASAMLSSAYEQIAPKITVGERLGVAIGTSSGGMATSERFFALRDAGIDRDLADGATYHAPFRAFLSRIARAHTITRATHPVTACSASTIAIAIACEWLATGEVDCAIAGGYDALTLFVAAGFEALGATTAHPPPRPFRSERDGMSLGEGAALFLLRRGRGVGIATIAGAAASGDAVHLTAPDRTGGGLARAASAAIARAEIEPATIGLVSVHGTSTAFNDPMEAKAIGRALGRPIGEVEVHAAKAAIGHTLGAAGALETALSIDALVRGIAPATAGSGTLDPHVGARPREVNEAREIGAVLKLSAAFGGANAALVVTKSGGARPIAGRRASRVVAETAVDETSLDDAAAASGVPRDRLARMDEVCRFTLHVVGRLAAEVGRERLAGAGIVLGSALATIDVNAIYGDVVRARGATHAEGRRFAYTTPNAAAGECSIAFGLTGPNVAVSRGWDAGAEAAEIARDLIGSGVERMVVVAVDAPGPVARMVAEITGAPIAFGARAWLLEGA
jgi:3-oxoacyl-[acyl-carrier-protein] synthase-1/3-oxoacyl-[acyl-carrier-protein] synthase II